MADDSEPIENIPAEDQFAEDDLVTFHFYGETVEHIGTVVEAPEEGKLTVSFDDIGTLKINRCYLRMASLL